MNTKPSMYDTAASWLVNSVRQDENPLTDLQKYEDDFVKLNVVHARQDIIMLVSHLSSLNKQVQSVRHLLMWILAAIIAIALKVAQY